ncbi:MAG: tyrosine-type recombinase/integrase, partial [Bacteroidetes bacterium]|nr:tyrosine-type recombinase/integrase [Bacteroidota bacterium]
MPLSPQKAIQSFLDFLKYQKRYSRHTIISYETDLVAFFDYMEKQYQESAIENTRPAYIRSWLAEVKEAGMSSKTINRKISSLRSFFKNQLKEGNIEVSPMATITAPRVNKRLPQFVEKKDISTLFDHVEFPDDWTGYTERIIMQILYNTGIRQAELINLKESQVDVSNCSLKVLGKGSKERIIPVSAQLMNMLKGYIQKKQNMIEHADSVYLLVKENGKKLYPKYVYNVVKKYLALVTTIDKKSPHVLRHTFA